MHVSRIDRDMGVVYVSTTKQPKNENGNIFEDSQTYIINRKDLYIYMHAYMYADAYQGIGLTMEFTLTIRLGEPLIRDGKSKTESSAGAR